MPDPRTIASSLGVSSEAVELCLGADFIDLHLDTFIPHRIYRYDVFRRHGRRPFFGRFFGHVDHPRLLDAGLTGAMWSITTNPLRPTASRLRTFEKNLTRLIRMADDSGGRLQIAPDFQSYRSARDAGAHAVLPAIQGGNAWEADLSAVSGRYITRVTVVHLTNSGFGASSAPVSALMSDKGLSGAGRDFVRRLDEERIFIDLAHIHPDGFWDTVDVHDPALPLIVTHTGVTGVTPHWRNLDDRQIKAIADSGGTIGIIFSENFLKRPDGPNDSRMIVEHMEHIIDLVGEDFVSVGSDYDGAILPPSDVRSVHCLPRLVQHLLDRGHSTERVEKIMAKNFLRAFEALRPGPS